MPEDTAANEETKIAEFYQYMPAESMVSLDDLYEKFNMGYYHSLESLELDLGILVENTRKNRCKNELACRYMDYVMNGAVVYLRKKQNEFLVKWRAYYESRFTANQTYSRVQSWYKSAGPRRHYNYINDYKVVTSLTAAERTLSNKPLSEEPIELSQHEQRCLNAIAEKEALVVAKMSTAKKSKCGGQCCY